jgi:hypothetical protein
LHASKYAQLDWTINASGRNRSSFTVHLLVSGSIRVG